MKEKLLNFASKFESNIYIKSISSAMSSLMPVMIVSSIASLIASINIGGSQAFMESTGILSILDLINFMTIEMVSVYTVVLIAYKLGEHLKSDPLNSAIVGLMAFFILTPIASGEGFEGLAFSNLGSGSMFVAMVAGVFATILFKKLMDAKITLSLPESVPPVVGKSFSAIVPSLIIATVFGVAAFLLTLTPFSNLQNVIMYLVSEPLKALGANIWAVMIIVAFAELLWFFGIHGSMAIYPVILLVFYQPGLENLAAFSKGLPLPHLFTMGFVFNNRGARSLAVSLLCMFQAKSARLKAIGKIGFVPSLFGISEPIKFGIPQVLNLKMLFPLMITPAASVLTAYILTKVGFLPYHNGVSLPLGSPVIIQGFFFNGWQGIVSQLLQLLVCTLIYIPFIKSQDKVYLAEEGIKQEELEKATAAI